MAPELRVRGLLRGALLHEVAADAVAKLVTYSSWQVWPETFDIDNADHNALLLAVLGMGFALVCTPSPLLSQSLT